jgi:hypothetical protein
MICCLDVIRWGGFAAHKSYYSLLVFNLKPHANEQGMVQFVRQGTARSCFEGFGVNEFFLRGIEICG